MSDFASREYYTCSRNDGHSSSSKNFKYVNTHTEDLLMSNIDMYDFDLSMQLMQLKVDKMKRGRLSLMQSLENIKSSSKGNSYIFDYPTRSYDNTDNEIKCLSERLQSRKLLSPKCKSEVVRNMESIFESQLKPMPDVNNSLPKTFKLHNLFSPGEENTTKQSESQSDIKRHIKNVSSR
jgi:hypothetical protein